MSRYKQLVIAMAGAAVEDEAAAKELKRLTDWFLEQEKPGNFSPFESENVIVASEKGFETLIGSLEENGAADARKLSEFSFYCRVQQLEQKVKELEKYGAGKR